VQERIKRPLGDELLFGKLASGGHVLVDVPAEALATAEAAGSVPDETPSPITFHFESESRLPVPAIAGVNVPAETETAAPADTPRASDPRSRPN
jgi:hypothetical protein